MEKYHLDFKTTKFFFSAGPGSYTGMRLAEGIAQVLDWESNNVYSFYHFDVPQMIGIKKGYWVTNAFKGQVFIYNWDDQLKQSEKELVDSKDFEILNPNEGYTLSSELDDFKELNTTKDLIKNLSEQVFLDVLNKKLRNAPYYFRTLEEEFK
jgi:tRNA threonylcarbamoyladenosine biosynthesis protein TsaB